MKEIKINVNDSSVFEARENLKNLTSEYEKLSAEADKYSKSTKADSAVMDEYNKKLTDTQKELNGVAQAIKEADPYDLTARFDDLYSSTLPLNTQIGELEDRLYALKFAGQENTAEFQAISDRVAEMKLVIIETDKQIDNMVENKGVSGMTSAFSAMGASIANLDFEGASKNLARLNDRMSAIDIGKMTSDFGKFGTEIGGTLVKSIGMAVKATMQFTVALLTNPVTWIAIAIVALVAGIYKLLDAFGLITPILNVINKGFDAFMEVINGVKQGLKDFSDWLGMTNYAEQDAAEKSAKYSKEKLEQIEKDNIAKKGALSNELKILQAKGVNTEKEIWYETWLKNEILRNEKDKTKAKIDAVQTEIKMKKLKGDLSDEEKAKIKEQETELLNLQQTIKDIDTDIEANIINTNKRIEKNREDEKKNQAAQNKALADERKQAADKRATEEKKEEDRIKELRNQAAKSLAKITEENRLNAIINEYDRAYEETKKKLESERDLILENETLKEEEKEKIKDYYSKLITSADKKRNDDKKAKTEKETKELYDKETEIELKLLAAKLSKINELEEKTLNDELEAQRISEDMRRKEIQKAMKDLVNDKSLNDDQRIKLEEFYQNELTYLTEKGEKERAEITEKHSDEEEKKRKEKWESINSSIMEGYNSSNNALADMTLETANQLTSSIDMISDVLADSEASLTEKVGAIAGAVLGMVSGILDNISAAQKEKVEEELSQLEYSSSKAMGELEANLNNGIISQEEYDKQMYKLELDKYNKEEAIKKQAFEQDKKMKIAQASISMLQGMLSAFTGAMQLGPIAGPIVGGILATAVGVMGAINIAKIKATKYQSGQAPTPPKAPSINMPSTREVTAPTDSTGMSSEQNYKQNNSNNSNQQTNITVSIGEIEDTSKKVNKYEMVGEL